MLVKREFVIGVDVGTASVRAGLFNLRGKMLGMGSQQIQVFHPAPELAEQSAEEIWLAVGYSVKKALKQAGVRKGQIAGIGFDATCSLVCLDKNNRPLTVSPTGKNYWNVILWMDHRAVEQAHRINAAKHRVLKYVGGRISPEMEPPKLLWIKEYLPRTWKKAGKFLDLADFLTFRATGLDVRSLCTTTCKWTYLGHEQRWDRGFFEHIGLLDLMENNKIGRRIWPMGKCVGFLTAQSARDLYLKEETLVGVGIIDAHAGGLGVAGIPLGKKGKLTPALLEKVLALIGGTSSCHMVVSRQPVFVPGVWGPYYSAMIPGMWLSEGGQSATGALIDHIIYSHASHRELLKTVKRKKESIYQVLNQLVKTIQAQEKKGAQITADLHVLPYFHGNRSPRADPEARGIISGLSLDNSPQFLAKLYYATIQAIAYGTRHIIEEMNRCGHRVQRIHACGGGTKNPLWLQEHADITGCQIVLPRESEAVLLGSAILGAVAAGKFPNILSAMEKMSAPGEIIKPQFRTRNYHEAKYKVFQKLYSHLYQYRKEMNKFCHRA